MLEDGQSISFYTLESLCRRIQYEALGVADLVWSFRNSHWVLLLQRRHVDAVPRSQTRTNGRGARIPTIRKPQE